MGYLLWMAAAAIAYLRRHPADPGLGSEPSIRLLWGWFLAVALPRRMFLVHDRYLGEAFLYITYAFFTGLLVVLPWPPAAFGGDTFLVSVVLLGLSVLTDALQGLWPNSYETVQIFEEGFKFLGIAAWLSFWCHYVVPPPSQPPLSSTDRSGSSPR